MEFQERLTMANIANGALQEQFETELEKVLDNIMDPNTEAEKARKITVTLELKPNEKRNMVNVKCQTKSTTIPANTIKTALLIGKDTNGKVGATELDKEVYGQLRFTPDGNIEEAGKVVSYKRPQEGK